MEHRPQIVVVEDEMTQCEQLVDDLVRQNFRATGVEGGASIASVRAHRKRVR
jgi:hypothetical protein